MPKSPPENPQVGEVWDVRLGPTVGVEQSGIRPALVLSNEWFNIIENYLFVAVPITGTDHGIRYQVKLKGREGGLSKNSVVMVEQMRSMDRARFLQKRGSVSEQALRQVQTIASMIVGDTSLYPEEVSLIEVDPAG